MNEIQSKSTFQRSVERLKQLLEDLTGQCATLDSPVIEEAAKCLDEGRGLGMSQFNELLLLHGFDRIKTAFFQYLVDGSAECKPGVCIDSFKQLEQAVTRFQKLALQAYGNVKYGFKRLSTEPSLLWAFVSGWMPIPPDEYKNRHEPIFPVDPVDGKETYFLGYIVERELKERLENDPDNAEALQAEKKRKSIVEQGIRNQEAYLASDHLDVYVATSMRKRHEYLMVNDLVGEIFKHKALSELKLRWFDPTQAYCADRIDKGLAEGLMLKRAKCTLYFVQESDTIGKDSELAATLAQSKPVVAYVPEGNEEFVEKLISDLEDLYPEKSKEALILEQLQVFEPQAAWVDSEVRSWLENPSNHICDVATKRFKRSVQDHYRKRADTLMNKHPLGIQVCLQTGVANGVLVVRTVNDCAELIRRILLNKLEFTIDPVDKNGNRYLLLRETISNCVFRVMTGDIMLTNAFWNFYLAQEEYVDSTP